MRGNITVIKKGDEIATQEGYLIVTGYNGSIVYTDSYEVNEDGRATMTGGRGLTLEEIGHLLKEIDRCNHRVVFEDDVEESV